MKKEQQRKEEKKESRRFGAKVPPSMCLLSCRGCCVAPRLCKLRASPDISVLPCAMQGSRPFEAHAQWDRREKPSVDALPRCLRFRANPEKGSRWDGRKGRLIAV